MSTDERPTIDDVARAAGVSVATVSRALRGMPNVAESTRTRVRDAARELDYETHRAASSLASGRTMTIGLVAPFFGSWYANRIVGAAEQVLAPAGFDLLLGSVRGSGAVEHFARTARSYGQRIDGALLVDFFAAGAELDGMTRVNVPAVSVGEQLSRFPSVTVDNAAAAERATRHLLDLGHRRIGLVGGDDDPSSSPVIAARRHGYSRAHSAAGIEADPLFEADGDFSVDGGARATEHLLGLAEAPTAIFYMSDLMAIGGRAAITRLGCSIPRDVSIVGFDDHELSASFGLTTMRQDVDELGSVAAEMLLGLIGGRPTQDHQVPVMLTVRESTCPPR